MKFSDYSFAPEIHKSIDRLGFVKPTDIQYKSIHPIMRGEDVLAIAQTGTGKTAAFALPVVNHLHSRKQGARRPDGIKCVVMVPTRELAVQITDVFNEISKNTLVKPFCVFGGVEQDSQISALQDGVDILVATPGRLFDLVSQGYLKLHRVETLILDEADKMLDLGFIKDIKDLMKFLPKKRQTLFFSATINKKIKELAYSLVKNAIRIQISPKDPVSKNVNHSVCYVDMDDKRFFLERLVEENPESKILVFVRTKVRAERVQKAMERVNINSLTIHGDKGQKDRLKVLESFKKGEVKMLIATDVSARGIDIPGVDYVVNYDLPEQADNYVHRVGRTGRGRNKGIAVSFCSTEERELLAQIEKYTNNKIAVIEIDKKDYSETIDFSMDASSDWKTLLREAEEDDKKSKVKKPAKKSPKKGGKGSKRR
jgi:ATP-dependent RNA helicase RhlE